MLRAGTCHVAGVGRIEPATAARMACEATVLGAILDASGQVLALGRSRRLVSKQQRRALMVRDAMCRFPGCHRSRHLHAHHVVAWQDGGPTDLDNLILLCRSHHIAVHEGGITIRSAHSPGETPGRSEWQFLLPDGRNIAARTAIAGDTNLAWLLHSQADRARRELAGVASMRDPKAQRIMPAWAGEPFSVHECVAALWRLHPWPGPSLALAS